MKESLTLTQNESIRKNHSESDGFMGECMDYFMSGFESIIEDEVVSLVQEQHSNNWNLISRNLNFLRNRKSVNVNLIWIFGFILRHFILLPLRILFLILGVFNSLILPPLIFSLSESSIKRKITRFIYINNSKILNKSIVACLRFHDTKNRPLNGICVANHTTPLDTVFLMSDNLLSITGQRHSGFLGILQKAVAEIPSIFIERSKANERSELNLRISQHVKNLKNPPILILPEGTCTNNTAVMQFKKGIFEDAKIVHPVAIKYDTRFANTFWDSSRYSMMKYIFILMTSWGIVGDVWYLSPMEKHENESAIDFADRVKDVIAKKAGLKQSIWDGQLKRRTVKDEWIENQKKVAARSILKIIEEV